MLTSPATSERQRFFPLPVVLVLGVLIGALLLLAYPRSKLDVRVLAGTDSLSIAYLEAWLRIEPNNAEVQAVLTRAYLRGGRSADVARMLDRLDAARDASARQNALAIRISIAQRKLYALKPDDPARPARIRELDALLAQAVDRPWDLEALGALARQARGLGDNALAGRYYARLAQQDPAHADAWLAELAATRLGGQDYRAAADAWFALQARASTRAARRDAFIAGVKALQSGNDMGGAMAAAQAHLGDLGDDPDTLRFLSNVALAAGRPDLAAQYVKRLLQVLGDAGAQAGAMRLASLRLDGAMGRALTVQRSGDGAGPAAVHAGGTEHDQPLIAHRNDQGLWLRAAWLPAVKRRALPLRDAAARSGEGVQLLRIASTTASASSADGKVVTGPISGSAPASANAPAAPADSASTTLTPAVPVSPPSAAATDAAPKQKAGDADFALAYRVFLAAGDVASAERVANQALERDPGAASWRERLAQVAEWNHHPDVALANYLALAQSRGDAHAWQQVARLAPGLNDQRAMLALTLHQADTSPGDIKRLDAVVNAYELNGDPDGALRFLQARFKGPLGRLARERYATEAERKGDDDLALCTWQDLERDYGPNAGYALKIATMLYTRTRFDAALAAMNEGKRGATPADQDFWRFYALLGTTTQQQHDTGAGYRELLASGKAGRDDLEAMIGFYDDTPIDAARLAEYGYRQTGNVRMLTQAIYYYERAHARGRIAPLLASLSAEQLAAAEQSAPFLLARAQYERDAGRQQDVARDVQRALAIAPDSTEAQVTWLWYLNDRGTEAQLRDTMSRYGAHAESDAPLWPPMIAAALRLGDGRMALHYLRKQADANRQDPLWRLTFADALELEGRADDAWQLRKSTWIELARRRRDPNVAPLPEAEREDLAGRFVSLTTQFANGDQSRAVLIAMLRADAAGDGDDGNGGPGGAAYPSQLGDFAMLPPLKQQAIRREQRVVSAIAREAAVSWAQAQQEPDLEHAWLTRLFIDRNTRPVYAEAQLAIDEGDVDTLNRLLDTLPDLIPRQNRVDAQALTGRLTDAQSTAYQSLIATPHDDVMQQQLRDNLMKSAQSVDVSTRYSNQGALRYNEQSASVGARLTPSQSVRLTYRQREQSSDAATLPHIPSQDRVLSAMYRHQGQDDQETLTVDRREALRDITTARVDGRARLNSKLTLSYAVGYNQDATETTQLMVGGVKDLASVGLSYQFDPHWFGSGRYEYSRFHGQDRTYFGDGHLLELSAGYKIKADYPDYTIRAVFTHGQYGNAGGVPGARLAAILPAGTPPTAAAFMPQTFTQGALLFSFGDDLPETYSKGWRPMFSAGPVRDSRAGWTGQVELGLAGSVFGGDQALLYGLYQGASSNSSTSVKEIGARYRWLY
ncbi:tetratricopeptide repeat protein [Burkholderia gladioli]|uniref:Tetratricopeptide TPR_2 n=1 Tax=Burkholderia gladioli (strain BSR3) TaxID=999541 RepID=F2LN46_BURGS|nr:tetratricopeptide repeat protein [Burkholderia gladioli]AEA63930.1 Tetratricopeptide TPR_2 [Burkholderia gladioli BSR3]MBW5281518.1 tetratricopeptide repeat protein [Burkholderia gladioli]